MILIVGHHLETSKLWARHLDRIGLTAHVAMSQDEAVEIMSKARPSVILLDLMPEDGSAIAVADYASYRWPDVPAVFVSRSRFFSDASIFAHIQNAAAIVPANTPPSDMAEILAYHGRTAASAA